jgi:aspartate/methionine/tyrosine aminotransferase
LHADDLVSLAGLCQARDLPVIGDEVFADYPLDPAPYAASVLDCADIVAVSLGGLSKSAGLPQLKLGWIAFSGPEDRVSKMMSRYEIVADAYLSVGTPVQVAAPALCEGGAAVRQQIQERLRINLAALRSAAAAYPAACVLPVEGGWSAVIQLPATRGEEALVLSLLSDDHVIVHPGYFFDFERESFVVVSLLVEPILFARGIGRLLARATDSADQS